MDKTLSECESETHCLSMKTMFITYITQTYIQEKQCG